MSELLNRLRGHVKFYASFLEGPDADIARGDPRATLNPSMARHDRAAGRFGGGLAFTARDHGWVEDECVFSAAGNFPYDPAQAFGGTIAMWLRCDPDADLAPGFPVDPFHISRHPADGSFYLDLTRPNDDRYGSPRKLRFGIYPDSPLQNRLVGGQLLVVGELNWRREWHHVAATWENVNSGAANGRAALYLDGVRRSWMEGYAHRLTWNPAKLRMGFGQRFVGEMSEVLILDRAMSSEEVAELAIQIRSLRALGLEDESLRAK